ncbi:hypothetical protein SAMN02927924_01139 [Sphingobium faniae]|nr:hypothetical protein SAMN02927924_01139 [Sphingobium faniae]
MKNRQWILTSKPMKLVTTDELELRTGEISEPGPGEVLLQLLFISLDPGQQVYMTSTQQNLPGGIVNVGDVVRAWAVGRVVASRSERFPVGSYARDLNGIAGVQEYATLHESTIVKVDPDQAPLPVHLSSLGMPGLTAYFGMLDIGRPREQETVVVSGASGAVGSVAGQVARIKGCRTVGIAGGATKCRYVVEELGFDACVDYRAPDFINALRQACPEGIDVYFDNVGGSVLDACLGHMSMRGRIAFCGAVADYGGSQPYAIRNYMAVLLKGLRWEGVNFYRYADQAPAAIAEMAGWIGAGQLRHREDIHAGLENFVTTFHKLFEGGNFGKLILQVHKDEDI